MHDHCLRCPTWLERLSCATIATFAPGMLPWLHDIPPLRRCAHLSYFVPVCRHGGNCALSPSLQSCALQQRSYTQPLSAQLSCALTLSFCECQKTSSSCLLLVLLTDTVLHGLPSGPPQMLTASPLSTCIQAQRHGHSLHPWKQRPSPPPRMPEQPPFQLSHWRSWRTSAIKRTAQQPLLRPTHRSTRMSTHTTPAPSARQYRNPPKCGRTVPWWHHMPQQHLHQTHPQQRLPQQRPPLQQGSRWPQ